MKEKFLPALFTVFVAGTLAAVPMRVAELLFAIDQSGFYVQGSAIVPALNTLLVVLTLVLVVPYFVRPLPFALRWRGASRATGVIACLLGLCFLTDIFSRLYDILSAVTFQAGTAFGDLLIAGAALLSAVYFFRLGAGGLTGRGRSARREARGRHSLTALFPILWGVLILTVSFMHYTTIANISEQLFDVLKMVFVLLFFYYNARVTGGMPNGKELRGLVCFGLPAVLFICVTTPPRLIARMLSPTHGAWPGMEGVLYLVIAVYILDVLVESWLGGRGVLQPEGEARPFVDYETQGQSPEGQTPEQSPVEQATEDGGTASTDGIAGPNGTVPEAGSGPDAASPQGTVDVSGVSSPDITDVPDAAASPDTTDVSDAVASPDSPDVPDTIASPDEPGTPDTAASPDAPNGPDAALGPDA